MTDGILQIRIPKSKHSNQCTLRLRQTNMAGWKIPMFNTSAHSRRKGLDLLTLKVRKVASLAEPSKRHSFKSDVIILLINKTRQDSHRFTILYYFSFFSGNKTALGRFQGVNPSMLAEKGHLPEMFPSPRHGLRPPHRGIWKKRCQGVSGKG